MSAEGAGLRLSGRSNLRVSSGSAMSRSGGLRRVSGASSAGGSDATSEHSSMHRSSPKPKRHGEARGISSASLARASSAGRTKRKKGSGYALEYVIVFDFIVEFLVVHNFDRLRYASSSPLARPSEYAAVSSFVPPNAGYAQVSASDIAAPPPDYDRAPSTTPNYNSAHIEPPSSPTEDL